ncbi:uncharacterized protein LOC124674763 [Lolium rigidum]|uniref:uncharacterized protein LOC124674763 n=1 Tax=Lolium rigidum TaxID=89674 RepID=UPI001F5D7DE0|nr:uncharacterized protein LOC124674763 [Lolium rigidum]XP_047066774.1 uncharacterized protein LOC124674763 [Lolium rigidum]
MMLPGQSDLLLLITSGGEALELFYEKCGAKILLGLGFNLQMQSKITLALPLFLNFGFPIYGYSLLNFHWRYNNQYTEVVLLLGYSSFSASFIISIGVNCGLQDPDLIAAFSDPEIMAALQ